MFRKISVVIVICLVLGTASIILAAQNNLVLSSSGLLYQLLESQRGLQLVYGEPGEIQQIKLVPQTAGDNVEQINLAVDAATGTAVAMWQEDFGEDASRIQFATYHQGVWFGPLTLAGDDGIGATNPAILIQRAHDQLEDGEEVATTMVHMAWWSGAESDDGGFAVYTAFPLNDDGVPEMDRTIQVDMHNFIPYAVSCDISPDSRKNLNHPSFFINPASGDPTLLFADLTDCLFEMQPLEAVVEPVNDDDPVTTKRRRHVVVFGVRKDIALPPLLNLAGANFEVGHGLTVVAYWDTAGGINYLRMDDSGWSDVRELPVTSGISHEDAIELIRHLAW